MTKNEAKMIVLAAITTNESGCDEEILCEFSRSVSNDNFCCAWVLGKNREIIEKFDTMTNSPLEIAKQILKYRKAGGLNGNDAV